VDFRQTGTVHLSQEGSIYHKKYTVFFILPGNENMKEKQRRVAGRVIIVYNSEQ
jgi:hypothetical protein